MGNYSPLPGSGEGRRGWLGSYSHGEKLGDRRGDYVAEVVAEAVDADHQGKVILPASGDSRLARQNSRLLFLAGWTQLVTACVTNIDVFNPWLTNLFRQTLQGQPARSQRA